MEGESFLSTPSSIRNSAFFPIKTAFCVPLETFPRVVQSSDHNTLNGTMHVERPHLIDVAQPSRNPSANNWHTQGGLMTPISERKSVTHASHGNGHDEEDLTNLSIASGSPSIVVPLTADAIGLGVYDPTPLRRNSQSHMSQNEDVPARRLRHVSGNASLRSHMSDSIWEHFDFDNDTSSTAGLNPPSGTHDKTKPTAILAIITNPPPPWTNKSLPPTPNSSSENIMPMTRSITMPMTCIPLPVEIVDSLRFNVNNFPDTFLLTNSLAIEAIRAFSKKLRRGVSCLSYGKPYSPRRRVKSAARRLFRFSKRLIELRGKNRKDKGKKGSNDDENKGKAKNRNKRASLAPTFRLRPIARAPVWEPIKNIFPAAADRLCDSLYAHIVAYNYIKLVYGDAASATSTAHSAPLPVEGILHRANSTSTTATVVRVKQVGNKVDCHSNVTSNTARDEAKAFGVTRIPSKAVRTLGLSDKAAAKLQEPIAESSTFPDQQQKSLRRKSPMVPMKLPRTWPEEEGTQSSTDPSNRGPSKQGGDEGCHDEHHQSKGKILNKEADSTIIGDLQAGLSQCIAHLAAELKRSEPGRRDVTAAVGEAKQAMDLSDVLLVRSLCEVVRYHEETVLASCSFAM